MYKPQLYSKHNVLQKRDAAYVLDKFLKSIKWQSNEKILDVGCGDGTVTTEVILPHVPQNFEKLIGTDISSKMIEFADENRKTSKVSFRQFDITSSKIPEDFKQEFDHIFSFYCLHWVQDQKRAFQNIYDMLKPGGTILVSILANHSIYPVYEEMGKSTKWAALMNNFDDFVSPYYHSEDAGKDLKELLIELGFVVHSSKIEKLKYEYSSFDNFKKAVLAVNPFVTNMSDSEINDHFIDMYKKMRKLDTFTIKPSNSNDNEECVGFIYESLIAYASKPL